MGQTSFILHLWCSLNTHTHNSDNEFMVKFNLIWHSKIYPCITEPPEHSEYTIETSNLRGTCVHIVFAEIILIHRRFRNACNHGKCVEMPSMTRTDEDIIECYISYLFSPFPSGVSRNRRSSPGIVGLKAGTVTTGLHLLRPLKRIEKLNHPFRCFRCCLQASIQVSKLTVVLEFL